MFTRRHLLLSAMATGLAGSISRAHAQTTTGETPTGARRLRVVSRTLEVKGKAAKVYGLIGDDGQSGLTFSEGDAFNVALSNETGEPTIIHWHGLTPPWAADGVADAPEPLLAPGATRQFSFPIGPAGTHWMHAHTLQEQNLLAAPLIVRAKAPAPDEQEAVVLLHDFSFKSPEELLAGLRGPGVQGHGGGGAASHHGMTHGSGGMAHGAGLDVNDIEYDAYLANDRTLEDPQVTRVSPSGRVRLRIINGATATGFWIDLGGLPGVLVAVDGVDVTPLRVSRVPLSMGQRADILISIPKEGGAFPILALREGARERTGIILATSGASVRKLAASGGAMASAIGFDLERDLRAKEGAALSATRSFDVDLTGDMAGYVWGMRSDAPLSVRQGETVAITMRNKSMMSHPMHLHGHRFRVVGLNGKAFEGATRDTLLIPPMASAKIAFKADNPGQWAFHCHHLYHMAAGMMTTLDYVKVG